jgi:DNA-binding XRE family transcriptional regulator
MKPRTFTRRKKATPLAPFKSTRRGIKPSARLSRADVPYTMKLPDGRTVFVLIPGRWTTADRGGELALLPDAVTFLDRVLVLAMEQPGAPSPGYIVTLREALGLTQKELGERIGVDKLTVSRWERGALRPSAKSLAAMKRLRDEAARKGVIVAA